MSTSTMQESGGSDSLEQERQDYIWTRSCKLYSQAKTLLQLPKPVRTREREVLGSIVFNLTPAYEDTAAAEGRICSVVLAKGGGSIEARISSEMVGPVKYDSLAPINLQVLSAAAFDFSGIAYPDNTPRVHTQPNSIAFVDVVLWRRMNAAVDLLNKLHARLPSKHRHAGSSEIIIHIRTMDAGQMTVTLPKALGGGTESARKTVLAHCAWCAECGIHKYRCSLCRVAYYCQPAHQMKDWKEGVHKAECPQLVSAQAEFETMCMELAQEGALSSHQQRETLARPMPTREHALHQNRRK